MRLSAWLPAGGSLTWAPMGPAMPVVSLVPLEAFRFTDDASLARWEQKTFKGYTHYEIQNEEGRRYLRSLSEDASCGLYMKTQRKATPDLYLQWKWRAREFPQKKEPLRLSNRSEDDFAARLYVIFLASNFFRSDVIEYIWDQSVPVGTVADSPYSDRIKLFVVHSGAAGAEDGGWYQEQRNPFEDYRRLFGKPPAYPIGILALMSDSDNTGTRASADFEEIIVGLKK